MNTPLLFHAAPLQLSFDAKVLAHGQFGHAAFNDQASIVFDQTAFYPESGGQLFDLGVVRGAFGERRVLNVQIDDDGIVHHLIAGEPLPIGTTLVGHIDEDRRRQHMAIHTGQHLLSQAFVRVMNANTVSSHLGETGCTIDLAVEHIADSALREAEALTNAIVARDLEIRAFFPTASELQALPLRRTPKVDDNIRIVAVGDFEVSPCGGTHCTHSAQVGVVHISGSERHKGKTRVYFDAGPRAQRQLLAHAHAIERFASAWSCQPVQVPGLVDKLKDDAKNAAKNADHLIERLGVALASQQPNEALLVAIEPGPTELARAMAKAATATRDAVVVSHDGTNIAVVCSANAAGRLDAQKTLQAINAAFVGKGGGKPTHAEGRLTTLPTLEALRACVVSR